MPIGDIVPELVLVTGGVGVLLSALFTPRGVQGIAALLALGILGTAGILSVSLLEQPQVLTVGAVIALGLIVAVLPEEAVAWRPLVALLSAATMTLGNLAALWQDDVRRLLGWSAVSQTGYALMAIVSLGSSALAIPALLFFLLAYALANLAAFGVVIELRGLTRRAAYAGLARAQPLLAFTLAIAFLSFIGIPPLAGFTAKLLLFTATIEAGYAWLAVLAIANTVISIAYYARGIGPAYFEVPTRTATQPVSGRWSGLATGIVATGVIAADIGAEWFLRWFNTRLLPH